jgi:hypothetical protein
MVRRYSGRKRIFVLRLNDVQQHATMDVLECVRCNMPHLHGRDV